jgi:hypothetical protein
MNDNTGFAAFAMFHAMKLHFTGDYDYVKYHGKTNVSKDTFANRKDKYTFYKLSRKYNLENLKDFYIANFLEKDVSWIGDISSVEGEENLKKWQKRSQSLSYRFEQDVLGLLNNINSPNEMLVVNDGQHPLLLNEVMQGTIAIETLVIMNDIMNFFPMWNKKINDTIIWPAFKKKCEKYLPFLHYDKNKFKSILKECLAEYA